jgi:hypothetical protein
VQVTGIERSVVRAVICYARQHVLLFPSRPLLSRA